MDVKGRRGATAPERKTAVQVLLTPEQLRVVDEAALEMQELADDGKKVSRAGVLLIALYHFLDSDEELKDVATS